MENLIFLSLMAIFISCLAKFLHYCVGEPKFSDDNLEIKSMRIFGFYGRWVMRNFAAAYERESERLSKLMDVVTARFPKNNCAPQSEYDKVLAARRGNIWQALGACPVCFCTWVAIFSWAIVLFVFSLSFFWIIICVPFSVITFSKL